jgi:hypothetical protein
MFCEIHKVEVCSDVYGNLRLNNLLYVEIITEQV